MITLDSMKSSMLTPEDALAEVEKAEAVSWVDFTMDGTENISANFPSGWNADLTNRADDDVTTSAISVNGTEYPLTKKAALDLTGAIGLRSPYVSRTPGALTTPHVNYWLENQQIAQRMLVSPDGIAMSFSKPGKYEPYRSAPLLETVFNQVREHFGTQEIYVDYKRETTLDRVALRIISAKTREIESLRNGTVTEDEWSTGVQFLNSMTGKTALSLSGYLFAWWCTNGAITTHAESSKYRRRATGNDLASASEWIEGAAPAVLDSLEHEIESVQSLVNMGVDSIGPTIHEIFVEYAVPLEIRASILENLAESQDNTAYGLLNAFTQVANSFEIPDALRQKLMTIGGDLTVQFSERCQTCNRLPIL